MVAVRIIVMVRTEVVIRLVFMRLLMKIHHQAPILLLVILLLGIHQLVILLLGIRRVVILLVHQVVVARQVPVITVVIEEEMVGMLVLKIANTMTKSLIVLHGGVRLQGIRNPALSEPGKLPLQLLTRHLHHPPTPKHLSFTHTAPPPITVPG